jgi:hypothetical protein
MKTLNELEKFIAERINKTGQEINETEGIEEKLNWGMLLAYEDMLDEVQTRLGTGIFSAGVDVVER